MSGKAGRKPAHILAASPKPVGRDAMWSAMRARKTFTIRDIHDDTDTHKRSVASYVKCLVAAGILLAGETGSRREAVRYHLDRDPGPMAPRRRPDGSEIPMEKNDALWNAMRILAEFTPKDLAILASTEESQIALSYASDYCKNLRRGGYLGLMSAEGQPVRYRFAKFTGPCAPKVQRLPQLFDPNTKEVIPLTEGGGDEDAS